MLNRMKIGPRLTAGFGALLLLLCGVAGLATYQTSMINAKVIELNDDRLPSISLLYEVLNLANETRRTSMRHVMLEDPAEKQVQQAILDEAIDKKMPANLAEYAKTVSPGKEAEYFEAIKSEWAQYVAENRKAIALSNGGPAQALAAREAVAGEGRGDLQEIDGHDHR